MPRLVTGIDLLELEMPRDAEKLQQLPRDGGGAGARGQRQKTPLIYQFFQQLRHLRKEPHFSTARGENLPLRVAMKRRRQLVAPQQRRAVPQGEIEIKDDEAC